MRTARPQCGLTPRSSADCLRQAALPVQPPWVIIGRTGKAPCRSQRLSSNVRPHRDIPLHIMSFESSAEPSDLGFTYRSRKNGDVEILHHGRLATTLRGHDAEDFLAEVPDAASAEAQQLMARLTGNYKRGNERLASQHARNRR